MCITHVSEERECKTSLRRFNTLFHILYELEIIMNFRIVEKISDLQAIYIVVHFIFISLRFTWFQICVFHKMFYF
jgi:hypothetical protein